MNAKLLKAVKDLPAAIAAIMEQIVSRPNFDATISPTEFSELLSISNFTDTELRLALLPIAATYSHSPISNFHVGAIVRGASGTLYFGANIEFLGVQLGQTIHAEQCAISRAWMMRESSIKDITINFSPCGHCRQFMNELNSAPSLLVQLPNKKAKLLAEYLPEAFGPEDIGIGSALMNRVDHEKFFDSESPLVKSALSALNMSHAPYSRNLSGVALRTKSGLLFNGAYAENAAFNPSLPPLQVAIIQMLMSDIALNQIKDVTLIEVQGASSSHLANTQATLKTIKPDLSLEYILL
jgi:cytidine deaminase